MRFWPARGETINSKWNRKVPIRASFHEALFTDAPPISREATAKSPTCSWFV